MSTTSDFLRSPHHMQIRVIERDGKRWLQQYRKPAGGYNHEYAWMDVAELPWPPSNVRSLKPPAGGR